MPCIHFAKNRIIIMNEGLVTFNFLRYFGLIVYVCVCVNEGIFFFSNVRLHFGEMRSSHCIYAFV